MSHIHKRFNGYFLFPPGLADGLSEAAKEVFSDCWDGIILQIACPTWRLTIQCLGRKINSLNN